MDVVGEHRMEMASLGFLEKFMSTFDLRKQQETQALQKLCSQTGKAQLSCTMPLRQESFALFLEH